MQRIFEKGQRLDYLTNDGEHCLEGRARTVSDGGHKRRRSPFCFAIDEIYPLSHHPPLVYFLQPLICESQFDPVTVNLVSAVFKNFDHGLAVSGHDISRMRHQASIPVRRQLHMAEGSELGEVFVQLGRTHCKWQIHHMYLQAHSNSLKRD